MPTTLLTFAWLLLAATPVAPGSSEPKSLAPTYEATVAAIDSLLIVGLTDRTEQDQTDWLLFESEDDEESDDTEELGLGCSPNRRPELRSPFGVIASNPHPTIIPRSALRLLVLRC